MKMVKKNNGWYRKENFYERHKQTIDFVGCVILGLVVVVSAVYFCM